MLKGGGMVGGRRDRKLYAVAALVAVFVAVISLGSGSAQGADAAGHPDLLGTQKAAQLELAPIFLLIAVLVALVVTWVAARRQRRRQRGED
jgi:ABC-type Fe3+ transport system permease subunit